MRALEAGGQPGEGDSRCTGSGIPADSAFLQVDREGEAAGTYLLLDVTSTAPQNPLVLLRARYDTWRAANPCPAPPPPDAGMDGDPGEGGDAGCCSAGGRDAIGISMIVLAAILRRRRYRSR